MTIGEKPRDAERPTSKGLSLNSLKYT